MTSVADVAETAPTTTTGEGLRADNLALAQTVDQTVDALIGAIGAADATAFGQAHADLATWCQFELVPSAVAKEQVLYPRAARVPEASLLVQGLVADHRVIAGLVDAVNAAQDAAQLAGDAQALRVLLRAHLAKEDQLLAGLLEAQDGSAEAYAETRRAADALAQQYAANVAADVEASHSEPTGGCGSGGGCGGCGGGGGCGSADDARTDEERAADKAAVTVTRVD
ncbi:MULTISPECIES: hemerythrin domain-containing protein [Arsenicicoccus]|uniref:hemerythrin domain-containing protein n=1 Tax=Arsenicicoccus TaxID=267408 RepID=UPI000411079E|nr:MULTISPECIES: hemerythrin domain-containing protein [Arsenicicoccus]